MKFTAILLFTLMGCGRSLSEEQRKEMHEKMEANKIVRVTEVEILEAALAEGRKTVSILDDLQNNAPALDSFLEINAQRIRYILPDASNARPLEQQLLEAYLADTSGAPQDNVQKLRNDQDGFDSLLYTKPVVKRSAQGDEQLDGVWNIWLSKKEMVLNIGKNK